MRSPLYTQTVSLATGLRISRTRFRARVRIAHICIASSPCISDAGTESIIPKPHVYRRRSSPFNLQPQPPADVRRALPKCEMLYIAHSWNSAEHRAPPPGLPAFLALTRSLRRSAPQPLRRCRSPLAPPPPTTGRRAKTWAGAPPSRRGWTAPSWSQSRRRAPPEAP
jgi:hypothetical protein